MSSDPPHVIGPQDLQGDDGDQSRVDPEIDLENVFPEVLDLRPHPALSEVARHEAAPCDRPGVGAGLTHGLDVEGEERHQAKMRFGWYSVSEVNCAPPSVQVTVRTKAAA